MTSAVHKSTTLDSLPKQFVSSMRTLFDLMDDKRMGYVKFSDIENWWREGGAQGLPNGVVDCLRKVTPANGLLTFERFCAGLRICLLRHDPNNNTTTHRARLFGQAKHGNNASRPASVPLPDRDNVSAAMRKYPPLLGKITPSPSRGSAEMLPSGMLSPPPVRPSRYNTATVRPNNVRFAQQRAISMPQLQSGNKNYPVSTSFPPPPPPPPATSERFLDFQRNKIESKRSFPPPPMSKAMVTKALEKWRMMKTYHPPDVHMPTNVPQPLRETQLKRESSSFPNLTLATTPTDVGNSGVILRVQERGPAAKKANRKREPRRHTVSNGIDYNMIKRLKLLEQEKDYLLQGLDIVERARNWYIQKVSAVSEKLEQISKWDNSHSEYSMEAHRERINFQMTRIFEVNQHLNSLMDTSEKGFPNHMNLAVHQQNIYDKQRNASQTIQRLKDQNHSLTEEIAKKSELITQLEAEKSALIRELFQARSQPTKEVNDNTLW